MRALTTALVVLILLPLSGCIFGDPDIEDMVLAIEDDLYPATLEARHELRLGAGLLRLGSLVVSWSDASEREAEQARLFLRDLDAVHVGAYDVRGHRWSDPPLRLTEEWRLELERRGWQVIVRVREHGDEARWVLARPGGGSIDGLYVVSLEGEDLVVVKLEGDLSRSIDYAVRRDESFFVAVREAGETH